MRHASRDRSVQGPDRGHIPGRVRSSLRRGSPQSPDARLVRVVGHVGHDRSRLRRWPCEHASPSERRLNPRRLPMLGAKKAAIESTCAPKVPGTVRPTMVRLPGAFLLCRLITSVVTVSVDSFGYIWYIPPVAKDVFQKYRYPKPLDIRGKNGEDEKVI
jgi:hypothetical protein